ncbi:P-loop containing nucleoside triphosphate hydrolase protein [Mycena capillaripes]|nr:P-loop containing nucleoside triphosphate hydrolase protein [Mycena capillaripes]
MPDIPSDNASSAQIDIPTLTNQLISRLEPHLEMVVDKWIKHGAREAQALYFPPPPPVYAPHDLRPVSNILPHPSRLTAIKGLLGQSFDYRFAEQPILIEKMILRESNILAIMTCGSGKTFFAMLAAKLFAQGRKTVFILPHSGLHHDFRRRASELGLAHSKWEQTDAFNPDVEVIYVAVEHIDFESFQQFLMTLCLHDRVSWIVFDEIHKCLTDISYRPIMALIKSLHRYGVPILGFSGTIPPQLEPDLFEITGHDRWDVIRMGVSRPNVRFAHKSYQTRSEARTALSEFVKQRRATYTPDDRMMVLCPTVAETKTVAGLFGTEAYISQTTEEGKALNLRLFNSFRAGQPDIAASTSLLGSGMDQPHVRDSINFGYPWSLFDLQQQADRAGRDGGECNATTFT